MYSTLAGFVEPGESLEEAVAREVFEEVGIRVGRVRYHSSQPWPFPGNIMLGFHAEAESSDIVIEEAELVEARWFERDEIVNAPQTDLTRISHRERCIGPKNRVKFFCDKGLTDSIGGSDANRVYLRSV
jgi:NAD+ diphosphatase